MWRRSPLVLALALGILGLGSVGAATAVPGSATLEASPEVVRAGDPMRVSGSLSTDGGCLAQRQVRLERLPAGSAVWEEAASGRTDGAGAFSFEIRPDVNASYRAVLPLEVRDTMTCDQVTSEQAEGWARVRVTLEARSRVPAGRCTRVEIEVHPPKPGHAVEVRRRLEGGWRTVADATLTSASRAAAPVCTTWGDLGRMRLRARWASQDDQNLTGQSPRQLIAVVKASWMRRIDRLAGGAVGVSVRDEGAFTYRHADTVARTPASNQKLLLSMALLDTLPPEERAVTSVLAPQPSGKVVQGNLWLVGRGDPEVGGRHLRRLARQVKDAGIRRVTGSVRGSLRYFRRDWWAPGWRSYFPARYVARPTALTYLGNVHRGRHVADPERRAAQDLTRLLRRRGVRVAGTPGVGRHPGGLPEVASVRSRTLADLLRTTDVYSSNFRAEVLGKLLAAVRLGPPGSIAKGARAVTAWAADHGVGLTAYDASGLSYANRATPEGIARLLGVAEDAPWGPTLRAALPAPGQGTLQGRLSGVPVRAKTGTLTSISALSGWVRSARSGSWVEFSILSSGLSTSRAKAVEDEIVRILRRRA